MQKKMTFGKLYLNRFLASSSQSQPKSGIEITDSHQSSLRTRHHQPHSPFLFLAGIPSKTTLGHGFLRRDRGVSRELGLIVGAGRWKVLQEEVMLLFCSFCGCTRSAGESLAHGRHIPQGWCLWTGPWCSPGSSQGSWKTQW